MKRKFSLVKKTGIIFTAAMLMVPSFSASTYKESPNTQAYVENCNIADDSFLDRPVSEIKYSSRELGFITAGKNQGSDMFKGVKYPGNCWAYALNAAAEASLKKFYPDVYKNKEPDLSEAEFAGQIWTVNTDPLGLIKIDHSSENFWGTTNEGGYNPHQAIYDLATGADLADEKNDDDVFYDSVATLTDAFNLKSARGNTNRIKNIIKEYGAVVVSITAGDATSGKVYLNKNKALYLSDKTTANHSVALIGWDDSLPAEFFTNTDGKKPSCNGGWIAKNSNASEGILTEDSYYFYISYEDSVLLSNEVTAVKCEPLLSEYNEYQYDESSYTHAKSRVLYASNIFTLSANKDGHETIDRVSFYADAGKYTIDIYNYGNNTASPWNIDGLSPISSTTVKMPFMQYKVFSIDPITLNYGDSIAIVIHRTDNSEFTIAYSGNNSSREGTSFLKGYSYLDDGTGRFNTEKYIYDKACVKKGIPRIKMFTTSNLDGDRVAKALSSVTVNNENDLEFNPEFKKVSPELSVYDEKGNLVPHRYYTVEYDDLVSAGTHTVTVTGDGDHFTGTVSTQFTIHPIDINTVFQSHWGIYIDSPRDGFAVYSKNASYKLKAFSDNDAYYNRVYLKRGIDFSDSFENLENNNVQYTITGKGNYSGSITDIDTVKNAGFQTAKVTLSQNKFVYAGSAIEPKPTIRVHDELLEEGIDYTISYSDNIEIGTATITITGIGHYEGAVTESFQISQSVPSDEPSESDNFDNNDIPGNNDAYDTNDENNNVTYDDNNASESTDEGNNVSHGDNEVFNSNDEDNNVIYDNNDVSDSTDEDNNDSHSGNDDSDSNAENGNDSSGGTDVSDLNNGNNNDPPGNNDVTHPTDENKRPITNPIDGDPSASRPDTRTNDSLSDNMVSVVVGSATITYPQEISFSKGKKAAFNTGDVTITDSDGSQLSFKAVKISKSTKAGSTSFKIKSPSGDKATAKLIKKYKFPVTIVPYEVSTKDSVTVNINTKGVLKSVLVNGIKLKKSEFSGTEDSLTFSGRFTGNWSK